MQHTLSVLVENKPGVLTRVASLFARRGFNIDSLAVGVTEDPTLSRITIVVGGEDYSLEQVAKQLHKLINVIKIQDLDPREMRRPGARALQGQRSGRPPSRDHRDRERVPRQDRRRREATRSPSRRPGAPTSSSAMEDLLRAYGIKELARTGKIALSRGLREGGA